MSDLKKKKLEQTELKIVITNWQSAKINLSLCRLQK